ncbi:MAG: hypothetical protein ABI844_12445 [Saprospiraceae bacterium]
MRKLRYFFFFLGLFCFYLGHGNTTETSQFLKQDLVHISSEESPDSGDFNHSQFPVFLVESDISLEEELTARKKKVTSLSEASLDVLFYPETNNPSFMVCSKFYSNPYCQLPFTDYISLRVLRI